MAPQLTVTTCARRKKNKSPSAMSAGSIDDPEVTAFMKAQGLEPYAKFLRKRNVDYHMLLALRGEDLREMGLPLVARTKMLKGMAAARDAAAKEAAAAPFAGTTASEDNQAQDADKRQVENASTVASGVAMLLGQAAPKVEPRMVPPPPPRREFVTDAADARERGRSPRAMTRLSSPERRNRSESRRRNAAKEVEVMDIIDSLVVQPSELLEKKQRSSSREASRLVADYADGDDEAIAEELGDAKPKKEPLPPTETKLPNWIQRSSQFKGIVAKTGNEEGSQIQLFPYGVDGQVTLDIREADDQYGDGLISFEEGRLWPDIRHEEQMPDMEEQNNKNNSFFKNRKSFRWRKPQHRLLGNMYPTPDGGSFMEQVLQWNIVEMFAERREGHNTAIVISEYEQAYVLSEHADRILPDPPVVFSRKGKKAGKHIKMLNFVGERKMCICEKPEDPEDYNRLVSRVVSVTKVQDDIDPYEEVMLPMKALTVVESGDLQGWVRPELGMNGENMFTMAPDSMRSSMTA